MMKQKILKNLLLFSLGMLFFFSHSAKAQYWTALPPYNTLWPLWSPALSPIDPITEEPFPIISSLSANTVLPVQPGLTWDPAWPNPWLLYNTPSGLLFYDPLYGINLWPPEYLFDPITGSPVPITLPGGYPLLAPTDETWLQLHISTGNQAYQLAYPQFAPTPIATTALPTALLAVFGLTGITIPAQPPASTTLLTIVDILGYFPTI